MLRTDQVGVKCSQKSRIYPKMLKRCLPSTLPPNLDFFRHHIWSLKTTRTPGIGHCHGDIFFNSTFSYLKSPPPPELELMRTNFNIVETSLSPGMIPSRLPIYNWLCLESKTENVNQYRSAILCITEQITNLDCSIKSLEFIDQEINYCLLGIRHNWISINRDRLSLPSLPKFKGHLCAWVSHVAIQDLLFDCFLATILLSSGIGHLTVYSIKDFFKEMVVEIG